MCDRAICEVLVGRKMAQGPCVITLSMHRDATAVKARARPRQPSCELEKICIQGVHGRDLADFAKGAGRNSAFLP